MTRSVRVPDELWMEVCDIVQETGIRPSPWKRNAKSKMAVWGDLTNSCEKKRSEKQRRKGRIYPFECRDTKKSKETYKSFLPRPTAPLLHFLTRLSALKGQ